MVTAYTASIVNLAKGVEAGLKNRDFAYWLNGAAVLTASVASIYFPAAGAVALTTIGTMFANATAFDFATFALVDAPAELGGTWSAISVSAAIFFFTDITGFVPLATQFFAYTPSASVAGALALIGTTGAVLGTTWKWMRMDEIAENQQIDRQRLASARAAGIPESHQAAWERKVEWKHSLDWCRYAIWTVTSTLGVVSQRFAETGNVVLTAASNTLPLSGVRIVADGARGFLALIGYYLGRGTQGTVLSPRLSAEGARIPGEYEVRVLPGREGDQERAEALSQASFWSLRGAQWISADRMLTRDVLKVARVGMKALSFTMRAAAVIPSLEGLSAAAAGIDGLSSWMKAQYTFTKLASLPAVTKKLFDDGLKEKNLAPTAEAVKFWSGLIFDGMYNVAAIPLYVANCSGGGIVLPSTVKWLLTESTKRWCALVQGVGIVAEIAGNVDGSQDKLISGAQHIWAGDFGHGNALYTIDTAAKIILTGATLAQWISPFGAFGTVMLVADGVKAGVGLYKKSTDTSKPEGTFSAYLLEKQWSSQGAPHVAVA
jgi:hypothetical protein